MPYRRFKRKLTARYLIPFILAMGLLTGIVLWLIDSQSAASAWIEHGNQVILCARDAELEVRRMQVGVSRYLYSRDGRCLNEIAEARNQLSKNLARVAALTADNPILEERILQISDLKEEWVKAADNVLKRKELGQLPPDPFARLDRNGQALVGALKSLIGTEDRLVASMNARQERQNQNLFILIPLLSAAVMLFLLLWGWRQVQDASDQFRRALESAQEARAKAERASLAKDKFLGTVSHELRNPLNSIMLWASTLLLDDSIGYRTRRGLTAIERAVRAQAQLVDDLLDVSRIESGRMRLDVQVLDLAQVVQTAVESMRAAVEAKSITLQEIIDPQVGPMVGDPSRLQQVVWNLLSNAVKFTPKQGKIQVRIARINSHIEIVVADNGQGIDPASLGSVFDRFWQADGASSTRLGVGLGLTIVKEIVELHGGTVSAHSDGLGHGSTFTVRLPLPVSKTPPADARRHPTGASTAFAHAARLDGYSILIVDDDAGACDALENLLVSLGARATAVSSVKAALMIVETLRPDAVVSDIGIPVHDGYFLARELRRREEARHDGRMPLVALTAYGRVEDKVKIFEAGFDNHVTKPVDPAELSAILGTLIASRRA